MTLSHSRAVDKVRHHQAVYLRDHRHAVTSSRPDVDVVLHDILAAQERSELHAALQTVTPRQREAITLTFFAGHSYPQASAILGVPLSTIQDTHPGRANQPADRPVACRRDNTPLPPRGPPDRGRAVPSRARACGLLPQTLVATAGGTAR